MVAAAALTALAGCGSAVGVTTVVPTSAPPPATASAAASTSTAGRPPTRPALPAPVDRCAGITFGAPLVPKDAPADPHVYSAPPALQIDPSKLYLATITTARGVIAVCLDPQLAPNTVNNFVVLARNHYYDGLIFHRVVPGFVIQGGDPKGLGNGGPGYSFADEPVKASYAVGAVAMANAGPNTNGSQFFICIGPQCAPLPPQYNLFGVVHSGQDVAGTIARSDAMTTVTVAQSP